MYYEYDNRQDEVHTQWHHPSDPDPDVAAKNEHSELKSQNEQPMGIPVTLEITEPTVIGGVKVDGEVMQIA